VGCPERLALMPSYPGGFSGLCPVLAVGCISNSAGSPAGQRPSPPAPGHAQVHPRMGRPLL